VRGATIGHDRLIPPNASRALAPEVIAAAGAASAAAPPSPAIVCHVGVVRVSRLGDEAVSRPAMIDRHRPAGGRPWK
jgi:hypothetical protein